MKGFWKNGKKQRSQKSEKYNTNDVSNLSSISNKKSNGDSKYRKIKENVI